MITIKLPHGEWQIDPANPLGPPGGFGEVFAGRAADGSNVAIKRLKVTASEAAHRELRVADLLIPQTLEHVVPILDAGQDAESDLYYIVMARAEVSLQKEIEEGGPLPEAKAVSVLLQICVGLGEVPQVVHRDLKPANVLYHDGRWKIADYGIARFVEDSTSLQTLKGFLSAAYAAPEQWNLEHATTATDVYALGCIAYALINGAPPFPGPRQEDFYKQHLTVAPPALDCGDPRLKSIISMMLRKPPDSRVTLTRIVTILRQILEAPDVPGKGVRALQEVGAIEATRRSRDEAAAAIASAAKEKRDQLANEGVAILREIMKRLAVEADRANCSPQSLDNALRVVLGPALLKMHYENRVAFPPDSMPHSKWDPIGFGEIVVEQANPAWSHGASLWYMRLPTSQEFRWFEVSYKDHALTSKVLRGPYALSNLEQADLAAGPGMHVVVISSGPTPIDGEDCEAFIDRWLHRLVS
jgi:eukaryotic-like serine/threonine-protein kinase